MNRHPPLNCGSPVALVGPGDAGGVDHVGALQGILQQRPAPPLPAGRRRRARHVAQGRRRDGLRRGRDKEQLRVSRPDIGVNMFNKHCLWCANSDGIKMVMLCKMLPILRFLGSQGAGQGEGEEEEGVHGGSLARSYWPGRGGVPCPPHPPAPQTCETCQA